MTAASETRYATSTGADIAYQVVGDGPVDLVHVAHEGMVLEVMWEQPSIARALNRLSSFSRLILFDHRGTGVSDPLPTEQPLTLEERVADVQAVLDAVGPTAPPCSPSATAAP
jgi:pimeloyl-ACP methyl ester carboxylesterase